MCPGVGLLLMTLLVPVTLATKTVPQLFILHHVQLSIKLNLD